MKQIVQGIVQGIDIHMYCNVRQLWPWILHSLHLSPEDEVGQEKAKKGWPHMQHPDLAVHGRP